MFNYMTEQPQMSKFRFTCKMLDQKEDMLTSVHLGLCFCVRPCFYRVQPADVAAICSIESAAGWRHI